jgi:hypothetical protein
MTAIDEVQACGPVQRLLNSITGMKFIAFIVVVVAACIKVDDDVQFALLVGGAFAALLGSNVANTRAAIAHSGDHSGGH